VKFGAAAGTAALPNFTLIREYLGVSGPKNAKNCQNVPFNFIAPQGRTPGPMSMKSIGFMRIIGLQKLLTSGAIRLVN